MLNLTISTAIPRFLFVLPLMLLSELTWGQENTAQQNSTDQTLMELLDQVWDFELESSPLMATNVGDPRGQDHLADDSLLAIQERATQRQEFLDKLEAIPVDNLSEGKRIDHELLRLRLEGQLADFRFKNPFDAHQ